MVPPPNNEPDAVFGALIEQYGALIKRIVARVGGRAIRESREDVAQQVTMSLWQQVSREQTITHPPSYIYRAAIRETVRAVKRELELMKRQAPIDDTSTAEPLSTTPDPEEAAASAELGTRIERALKKLAPEREQAVRAHLAGYTVDEIMRVHDWPYQKARNLIARGLTDLRDALSKGGPRG